jgi:anti-sigma B factor antagonist
MPPLSQEPLTIEEIEGPLPGQRVLRLQGPVVLGTLFQFQSTLRAKQARVLIIDFTSVGYIDSAGIGALVGAYVNHSKDGRSLALVGVNDRVLNALKATRVEQFFRLYPTLAEAQQAAQA